MGIQHKIHRLFFALAVLIAAESTYADKFYGAVSVLSEQTDNGNKDTHEKIKERQDQYNLSLGGVVVNSLIELNAEYNSKFRTYSETPQENNTTVEGRSSLLIGKVSEPADLFIEHSRITLLKSADNKPLAENQDEKNITSVTPTLRGRFSSGDFIFIKGKFSNIKYKEEDFKDSRRNGGEMGFDHQISSTDNMQVLIQQTNITFPNAPDENSNYEYRSAEFTYSTRLRQISYKVNIGSNQSTPEVGESYRSPKYSLDLSYNTGAQIFSLSLLQELTDASFGGGNKEPDGRQSSEIDSAHDLDRFERKRIGIDWHTQMLCEACTIFLATYYVHDQYLMQEEITTQQGSSFGIEYALSDVSTLSMQMSSDNNKFATSEFGDDFKSKTARIEYAYQMNTSFAANCYFNKEVRTALAGGLDFAEKIIGVGITYSF